MVEASEVEEADGTATARAALDLAAGRRRVDLHHRRSPSPGTEDAWEVRWDRALVEPHLKKALGPRRHADRRRPRPDRRRRRRRAGDRAPGGALRHRPQPGPAGPRRRLRANGSRGSSGSTRRRTSSRSQAAGDKAFVEAIVFRKDDVPLAVARAYDAIAGALAVPDDIPLAPTREFAAPILGTVGPVTAEMVEEEPDRYRVGDVAGLSGLQARYDDAAAWRRRRGRQRRGEGRHRARAVPGARPGPDRRWS